MTLQSSNFKGSEQNKPSIPDPVFLRHAEARVGPWLEARICQLIKLDRPEDAGALFREFETPEKGF